MTTKGGNLGYNGMDSMYDNYFYGQWKRVGWIVIELIL